MLQVLGASLEARCWHVREVAGWVDSQLGCPQYLNCYLANHAPCTSGNILPGCPEIMRNSLPITRSIMGGESGAFTLAGGGKWSFVMCRGCLYRSFSPTTLWMMGSRVFREDLKAGDISNVELKLPGCYCGLRFTDFSLCAQSSPKVHFCINTCHFMPQLLSHL